MTKMLINRKLHDKPKARLEHANFVVTDIEPTLDFIQTAFPEWEVRGQDDEICMFKSGLVSGLNGEAIERQAALRVA